MKMYDKTCVNYNPFTKETTYHAVEQVGELLYIKRSKSWYSVFDKVVDINNIPPDFQYTVYKYNGLYYDTYLTNKMGLDMLIAEQSERTLFNWYE